MAERVCVGLIAGPHGVRGLVKVRSFTETPAAIEAYGPLTDEAGQARFRLTLLSQVKDCWIARVDGVTTRDKAEALQGRHLFVERGALPAAGPDEFYHADLLGLRVETIDGDRLGQVVAVHNFGAGDVLEVRPDTGGVSLWFPFTAAAVPVVDVAGGRLVVDPPAEVEA